MPAKFQRNGVQYCKGFYIYWIALDDEGDILKWFKDAANAAEWSLHHGGKAIEMRLCAPFDQPICTED